MFIVCGQTFAWPSGNKQSVLMGVDICSIFNKAMLIVIIIMGIPYSVAASLSTADSEQLTEDLQNLSYNWSWSQSAADSANAILENSSYNSFDWDEFFYGYFTDNPFTDYLNNHYRWNLQYPIRQNLTEVQEGIVPALLNRSREIMNTSMSDLSLQLVDDNETLFNMHRFIDAIVVSGNVSNSTKNFTIYAFYKDEINTYNWLKSNVTINNREYPYLAALRAQIYMSFGDTMPLTNQTKDDIAQTLQLTGRYQDIWNNFSMLIHDNNGFDSVQLDVIYNFFDLISSEFYELRGITSSQELGVYGLKFEVKSKVNLFNNTVGSKIENAFPSDAPASAMVDVFTITLVHEVHHNVDSNYIWKNTTLLYTQTPEQNVTFKERKQDLIDTAGAFHVNYLVKQSNGYFYNNPQEFFAAISNHWFANTSNTLMHGITRFRNGYKDPLNQFLFFAEVYSRGENYTLFYNTDIQGNITRSTVPVTRDANGHINSLIVDGVKWKFTLDKQGNVIMLVTSPLESEVTSPTPNLEVFTREPSDIWYSWDSDGNISGCRNCTSNVQYNTTAYEEMFNRDDPSLVVLYHFSEGSGNTTADSTSNGNNGTLGNATAGTQPAWTDGKFGSALEFDGVNDFVEVIDNNIYDFSTEITVSAWINVKGCGNWPAIVGRDSSGPWDIWFGMYHITCGLRVGFNNVHDPLVADPVLKDVWSHVVARYNGTHVSLFINGNEVKTEVASGDLQDSDAKLYIGNKKDKDWFNGTIDEVAIYNRSLSNVEIQKLYCKNCKSFNTIYGENDGSDANLVTLWHFNENSGNMSYDDSINTNDGTINGPNWTIGKFGSALEFDGVDDFVEVIDNNIYDFSTEITVSAWINVKGCGNWPAIVGRDSSGSWDIWFGMDSSTCKPRIVFNTVHTGLIADAALSKDVWTHLVARYDGTNVSLFINGSEVKTGGGSGNVQASDANLYIGNKKNTNWFNGTIDEVAIYNRSLSAAEIQELYNKSLSYGSHCVTVYANDSSGNLNSTKRCFTVVTVIPTVTINSPANDTITDNTPDLNLTTDELVNITYSWNSEGTITGCQNCTSYSTTYGESVPDVNTILLLHLNENYKNKTYGESSYNNNGTIYGAAWTSGKFGHALDFDSNDYVEVPDDSSLDFGTDSFTIMAWIKTGNTKGFITNKLGNSNGRGSHTGVNGKGKFNAMIHDTGGDFGIAGTTEVNDSKWHHVAFVVNWSVFSDGTAYMYVDGSQEASKPITGISESLENNEPMVIGSALPWLTTFNFTGKIDEVNIIRTALNATEIADYHNKILPESSHNVTVYANYTTGHMNSNTVWFTIDTTPSITINKPLNATINDDTFNVTFGWAPVSWSAYSVNGRENVTMGNVTSYQTTLTGLSDGANNITVYANGSGGVMGSSTRYWTRDTTSPQITIDQPANATLVDDIPELNVTINETSNITYNWDGEGNISGCRLCTSYNTTYGELVPEANTSLLMHFNENNGLTAYDDSSNTNDGTLIDGNTSNSDGEAPPQWVPGKFGNALKFDGGDDYVSLQSEGLEQSQFTITTWVYPTQQKDHSILAYLYGQPWDAAGGYRLFISSENHIGLEFAHLDDRDLPVKDTVEGTINLPLNQWSFVAGTFNGSTMKVYVNGQFDRSGSGSLDYSGLEEGYIGRQLWNSITPDDHFNGTIDEVALYDRVLSIEEIQRHYNKSLEDGSRNVTVYANDSVGNFVSYTQYFMVDATPLTINITSPPNDTITDNTPDLNLTTDELASITYSWDNEGNITGCQNCTNYSTTYGEYANASEQNLVLAMHFNENNSNTTYDDSGMGNNGTIFDAAWSAGKFGPALDFDGSGDYVNVPDNDPLDFSLTDDFTMMVWFKTTGGSGNRFIFDKSWGSGAQYRAYHLSMIKGKLRFMIHANGTGSANTSNIKSSDLYNDSQWHHIAIVRNTSADKVFMYIDGAYKKNAADNTVEDSENPGDLTLGSYRGDSGFFNGTVDELVFVRRALSAAKISNIHNKTLPDGQHSVTVYAKDMSDNRNSTTRWFSILS